MAKHGVARSGEPPVDAKTKASDEPLPIRAHMDRLHSANAAISLDTRRPPCDTRSGEAAGWLAAAQGIQLPGLVGNSAVMQSLYAAAIDTADAGHPILISGRAGSGKSALARALHGISRRRHHDFRVLRCVAFPDFLAVTDPVDRGLEAGFAAYVNSGTLVLDEIGDLSFAAQTTLVRLLLRTQGPINVIALTHKPVQQAVAEGRFRSDLLHSLSTRHLLVPNLDERLEDVTPLAERFRESLSATNRRVVGFSQCALGAMHRHRWPGNLRELRNRIERALLMTRHELIRAEDLGLPAPHG